MSQDIIIGVDAGTSVIKSVAFDLSGGQIAMASVPNRYDTGENGAVTQCLARTWEDCAVTLRMLGEKVPNLASRCVAISVTGQGDGTWLIGKDNRPVGNGWLWLDARSAEMAQSLRNSEGDIARYQSTGTGLNACQQGVQLAYIQSVMPELLNDAETAFHCKDWIYLNLTGVRATDPSESCFTFGNYKTGTYDEDVIGFLGLENHRTLLPEICDGVTTTHPLTESAAVQSGLLAGTPVCLAYVDVVCTALGAGAYVLSRDSGCTIIGTTGMHIRCKDVSDIQLNTANRTGYVMQMPVANIAAHLQTNMAGTLNIDWVLSLAEDVCAALGTEVKKDNLLKLVDNWVEKAPPGSVLYHPYISEAGERGPFIDHNARSSFIGLSTSHGFGDLVRATIEGLALASCECYRAIGGVPTDISLSGGAAKSKALRNILSATLGVSVRHSKRDEAGAAGAAMMAAVASGVYADMQSCITDWVVPLLGDQEHPDSTLLKTYEKLYPNYITAREVLQPIWKNLASYRNN